MLHLVEDLCVGHPWQHTVNQLSIPTDNYYYHTRLTDSFPGQPKQHTHPFNGPLSGTNRVSRYQRYNTNLDFTEARDSEWQWHQLGRMQVCTSFQTDNHTSTPAPSFYRPDALPDTQPTGSKHWRLYDNLSKLQKLLALPKLRPEGSIQRSVY